MGLTLCLVLFFQSRWQAKSPLFFFPSVRERISNKNLAPAPALRDPWIAGHPELPPAYASPRPPPPLSCSQPPVEPPSPRPGGGTDRGEMAASLAQGVASSFSVRGPNTLIRHPVCNFILSPIPRSWFFTISPGSGPPRVRWEAEAPIRGREPHGRPRPL